MTRIEQVTAFRGPDGKLYDSRDACRGAVLRHVIGDEMDQSFAGEYDLVKEDVINVMVNKFDMITRKVDQIMGAR